MSRFNRSVRSFAASVAVAAALLVGLPAPAEAAILTGSSVLTGDTTYDLTTLGAIDWAYWTSTGTGTPSNSKLAATAISNITAVGGGTVQGSSSTTRPSFDFVFTDGTSPTSGTQLNPNGRFNSGLDTVGRGVGLSVLLANPGWHEVNIWGAGFAVDIGTFTATLPGAPNYVDTLLNAPVSTTKLSVLFTMLARTTAANQTLNVQFVLTDDGTDGSSHVLIGGAAVRAIPAPAALPAGLGLLAVLAARRRRLIQTIRS